ncbi:hypothetical protein L1887_62777 [Cichorium endivia]|nr:hypothetical protein L1887_62777 [Cichorium endivia]
MDDQDLSMSVLGWRGHGETMSVRLAAVVVVLPMWAADDGQDQRQKVEWGVQTEGAKEPWKRQIRLQDNASVHHRCGLSTGMMHRIGRYSSDPRGPSTSNEEDSVGEDCHRPLSIRDQSRQLARPVCAALVGKVASPPPKRAPNMAPRLRNSARKVNFDDADVGPRCPESSGLIAHP